MWRRSRSRDDASRGRAGSSEVKSHRRHPTAGLSARLYRLRIVMAKCGEYVLDNFRAPAALPTPAMPLPRHSYVISAPITGYLAEP